MGNLLVLSFIYLIGISLLLIFNELTYRRLSPTGEVTRNLLTFLQFWQQYRFLIFFLRIGMFWYSRFYLQLCYLLPNTVSCSNRYTILNENRGKLFIAIAIYLTFLFSDLLDNKFLYILPMLILAVSDPMAAILGINIKAYNGRIKVFGKKLNKTWLGSGAFLVSSFVISIIALYFHRGVFDFKAFWLAMLLSVVTMVAELISWRGSDNLSIPLSAATILIIFL